MSRVIGIFTSVALLFAGGVAMLMFVLELLLDTRDEKLCCPTLLGCYPCANPPAPSYWPLLLAVVWFTAGGLLLRRMLPRRPRGATSQGQAPDR